MNVAVLGAGGMGETVIGHLRACPQVTGIVAQDAREERVAELRAKGIEATRDLDALLRDRAIPLVFITASNDAHKPLALAALAAGKAVMCEKPIATTLADAADMVARAEALNAFFQIGFELRYSRLYTQIKSWIDAGLLGRVVNSHVYYCTSVWNKGSWRCDATRCGGMFGEKLSHYVDLPRWWIGERVEEVTAHCAPNIVPYLQVRDNYHATYRFAGGALSHLTFLMGPAAHFRGDPLQDMIGQQLGDGHALRYVVVGTQGAAETDVFARTIKRWAFADAPDYLDCRWEENLTWKPELDHVYFHNTLDQTHDIVRRVAAGLPPQTPARDALETMRLSAAAERSADLGRPVRLDEKLEAVP